MINKLFFLVLIFCLASSASAEISSQLEVSSLNFISQDYSTAQINKFTFIGAEIKSEKAENDIFKIDLKANYSPTNTVLSYFNLKELVYTSKIDTTTSLYIGRKMQIWSQGDEKWNLGAYQPQFRWSPLDVESQGLVGVFYEKNLGHWSLNLFGTPIFIPDQGPAYELKDGQFASSNPYFIPPPQNIIFQNVVLPIDYNVIKPETSDVVQQNGFGIKLDYKNQGYEVSLAGTYKPSNQFAFGYNGILVTNRVRVDVLPKSYYEKTASFDLVKKWQSGEAGFSVIYNEPETPNYNANYNSPLFQASTALVPSIGLQYKSIDFELAGVFIEGGTLSEAGPEATPSRQSLTQKYLYTRAYQMTSSYRLNVSDNFKILSGLQWREAEKNLLQTLKWKNVFVISQSWKFNLDIFLVETSDETSTVSSYRNLDQVWAGASYDF